MTLPIDPTAVAGEDIGEERATLRTNHTDAVERVREAFVDAGFGVITEYSISELLREKIGAERNPYYVLGACHPGMADRALEASDGTVGALTPCNVVVWEEQPDVQTVYHVSIMRIARLVGMAPDDETWDEIVANTGELVDEAFATLEAET